MWAVLFYQNIVTKHGDLECMYKGPECKNMLHCPTLPESPSWSFRLSPEHLVFARAILWVHFVLLPIGPDLLSGLQFLIELGADSLPVLPTYADLHPVSEDCITSEDNSLASLMELPCYWHCLTAWADLTSKEGTEYLFYTFSHLVTNSFDNRTFFYFFIFLTAFLTVDILLDVFLDVLTFTHFVHFSLWQALFFLVCLSLLDPLFVFQLSHKLRNQPSCVSNMSVHFSVPQHRLFFCSKIVLVFFGSFALCDDLLQSPT